MRTLRSRFFWNLFASYTAVLLVTALLVGGLVEARLGSKLLADTESTLRQECVLLSPLAQRSLEAQAGSLQPEVLELGHATGLRISIIREDGTVLADSESDPERMDDHTGRPEVAAARRNTFGVSRRHSHTLDLDMLYVAHRVRTAAGDQGFVRLAVPLTAVQDELAIVRRAVVLGTVVGFLVALALGFVLAGRITRPLAEMTRVAEDLREGHYSSRVRASRGDEIGLLGETLDSLGAEITSRIAALQQEDAQLRAMLAGMVEGVVAVDAEDHIAFVNSAARDLLGLSAARPEGRSLWELAPILELQELLEEARATDAHAGREVELHRGGKERIFQAHASPFQGGGRRGLVLVLHDISDLRRLERVRRDFVANVSHELKTPLAAIQGFVETLLSGAIHDTDNNVRFLGRIDANVKRLSNLVSDLLSLARIESGRLEIEVQPVDWRSVLDEVLKRREGALQAKGLVFEVLGRDGAPRVRGDREAMTQVLDNLIDNAIHYTPAPGQVRVRFAQVGDQGRIAVEDSGIGIPAADLDRIFERFYRVDRSRSQAEGSTGLGLSIVKNLVLRMGGQVTVESVLGEGTTFAVSLPLA